MFMFCQIVIIQMFSRYLLGVDLKEFKDVKIQQRKIIGNI